MQFRHEVKHRISPADRLILRQRLRAVATPDPHAKDGVYNIRSLYFDDLDDTALREKLDGVRIREKYRIRLYNGDTSFIRLERKFKIGELGNKQSAVLTADQARAIASGDVSWVGDDADPFLREFAKKIRNRKLIPKTIVDYKREPFIFAAGNVRITLDYDIRTGLVGTDFLSPDCVTVPVFDNADLLEVKWDAFLPDVIRDIIQLDGRRNTAFSKYAACRIYDSQLY